MRQAGDVLMGGASGAGGLLLNTKASQEAVCSRAPAAIVSGQEPARGAGVSRFSEKGSHPAETDVAEGHTEQVDGLGSSGNTGNGSHLVTADTAEGHAAQVDGLGSSGNAGNGSHLAAADTAEGHAAQVDGLGSSGNARIGSHPETPCHLCPSIARASSRVRALSRVKPPLRVRRSELRKAPLPSASPRSLARALIYVPLLHPMRIMAVGRE